MSLRIRPADVRADRRLIVECLRSYLTPDADEARYDWLYLANPDGPARAWIAFDEARGTTIGVASAFPRRAVVDGRDVAGWVLGDFCVHDEHRTLGPALQLQRACLEAVDQGSAAFCYDFPSRSMMAVYRRLRISPIGNLVRFARVVRWGSRLRQAAKVPVVREIVGSIGSLADLRRPPGARSSRVTVRRHDEAFGDEFDALDRSRPGRSRLCLGRSASHLHWRYRARPGRTHHVLTARDGTSLRGYAVLDSACVAVVDLVALDDESARALLAEAAGAGWEARATIASFSATAGHPLASVLSASGYRPRESSPIVFHPGPGLRASAPFAGADLPLTDGDRES